DVTKLKPEIKKESAIPPDDEHVSPWNIATQFKVDMSLGYEEIKAMLDDYRQEYALEYERTGKDKYKITIDTAAVAAKLREVTSGYPFLVSRLCKIIDEDLGKDWSEDGFEQAVKMLLSETNTNSEQLLKRFKENQAFEKTVRALLIYDKKISYNVHDDVIKYGELYGILRKDSEGHVAVANYIYTNIIFDYLTSVTMRENKIDVPKLDYITDDGGLDVLKVLQNFRTFIKEYYHSKNLDWLEENARLWFLTFLKPIINGSGFAFIEPEVGDRKRTDVMVTFNKKRYIIELKIWYYEKRYQEGLDQLARYLDSCGLDTGYILMFDFHNKRESYPEVEERHGKKMYVVKLP
ncbi:MAG: AAA family ATPase, partial [Lachnospiraceae bacterium]|nr:AAA family ATPase [Lachnospiraceae bacterium]